MYIHFNQSYVLPSPHDPPPDPNAVTIRIMYGSITVHMETFDCSAGARIYYGPLHCRDVLPKGTEEKLFGPLGAHQISLSPRHPAGLAKEIFNTMKRGLVLEVKEQSIYATALCRSVVYHGSSPMKCSGSLQKEESSKVFNYSERFLPDLRHYSEGHVGVPPKPYVILSLGQTWGSERPLTKNLVTIIVTYCKALRDLRVRGIPIHDELLFEAQEGKDIRIISPTNGDVEAEEFLNPGSSSSNENAK